MPTLPKQDWMDAPATLRLLGVLGADGVVPRFVGGCVRDTLAGRRVGDIDLATPDPPGRVTEKLAAAGLKAVPTGLAHGTVTALVGGRNFEITTLRRDVSTDGRRATVAFTDDWTEDAARRDFTFNAMSAEPDGRLHDPFGGAADLAAGRVRFVGEADARLAEDHLRLLRFFRFHAHFGRGAPEQAALEACARWAPKLAALSAERIRAEILKLLAADDPVPTAALMLERRILAAVLPSLTRVDALAALVARERPRELGDALRRLAALAPREPAAVAALVDALKLSNAERARLLAAAPRAPADLAPALYRDGAESVRDRVLLDGVADLDAALAAIAAWRRPVFPLGGEDVLAQGVPAGPRVGALLAEVEAWWVGGGFSADAAACRADLARRLRPA